MWPCQAETAEVGAGLQEYTSMVQSPNGAIAHVRSHCAHSNRRLTDRLNVNCSKAEEESEAKNHFLQKYPIDQPLTMLDGADVRLLLGAGYDWLSQHYETVNRLNVFPVPDGDTGTNMLLTIKSALVAAKTSRGQTAGSVMVAAAAGAHQGSRGNWGYLRSVLTRT